MNSLTAALTVSSPLSQSAQPQRRWTGVQRLATMVATRFDSPILRLTATSNLVG